MPQVSFLDLQFCSQLLLGEMFFLIMIDDDTDNDDNDDNNGVQQFTITDLETFMIMSYFSFKLSDCDLHET